MREIEIKARLRHPEVFFRSLAEKGFQMPAGVSQIDQIFVPKPFTLGQTIGHKTPVLRIRREGRRFTLTSKRDLSDELDSVEHQTEISNCDATAAILNEMGYHCVIDIRKVRRAFTLADINVCVDEVEELGTFIEIEAILSADVDVRDIRRRMWDIMSSWGVADGDQVYQGYDRLLDNTRQRTEQ